MSARYIRYAAPHPGAERRTVSQSRRRAGRSASGAPKMEKRARDTSTTNPQRITQHRTKQNCTPRHSHTRDSRAAGAPARVLASSIGSVAASSIRPGAGRRPAVSCFSRRRDNCCASHGRGRASGDATGRVRVSMELPQEPCMHLPLSLEVENIGRELAVVIRSRGRAILPGVRHRRLLGFQLYIGGGSRHQLAAPVTSYFLRCPSWKVCSEISPWNFLLLLTLAARADHPAVCSSYARLQQQQL